MARQSWEIFELLQRYHPENAGGRGRVFCIGYSSDSVVFGGLITLLDVFSVTAIVLYRGSTLMDSIQ